MSRIDEQLTEQFYAWEQRGRGWQVFAAPVAPEPAFKPFNGHYLPDAPFDDGRRPTFLSSLVEKCSRKLRPESKTTTPIEQSEEPEPAPLVRDALFEIQVSLPNKPDISKDAFEQLLSNLSVCHEPIAFELVGLEGRVTAQFAAHAEDAPLVRRQLQAYFPEAAFQTTTNYLDTSWQTCSGEDELAVEFGLAREFMLPLGGGKLDPFIGIIGALSELINGELGLFQVIFAPARESWAESIKWSVTHADGKPFFINLPELAKAAESKVAKPLYAAVMRIAIKAGNEERTVHLARDVASSLRVFSHPCGNELIPLSNEDYLFEDHIEDVLRRQSRRTGMLLNIDELLGFVHLPSSAVRSSSFRRDSAKTKAAPPMEKVENSILLGQNVHAGRHINVWLSPEQRVRHCHIIGASGTGKSTLLFNLISSDITRGQGVAVLDPHGDLIDRILGSIPPERVSDVILFDAADEEYSIGFNILTAHSELEKTLLASDLVSVFQRLSSSWGDQMASVMQNAILAFLESGRGGTLADLRRFLLDSDFRNEFLTTVNDPDLIYYWRKCFPQLGGNKSVGPVLTRMETFLAPKPVRYIVSQKANRLDFAEIMNSGKVFLAKLSQGQIGKENAFLLGSLLMSKFQQTAMSRQSRPIAERRDFWLYLDECHHFITPSTSEIITGARKYRMGLTLAHQELRQLQRDAEVANAVVNCGTRIVFRVGDDDARKLSDGFSTFTASDLQTLDIGQAVCRIERSDFDFNLTVPLPVDADEGTGAIRQEVITASRNKYGTSRIEVEAMLEASRTPLSESLPPAPGSRRSIAANPSRPAASLPTASSQPVEPSSEPALPLLTEILKESNPSDKAMAGRSLAPGRTPRDLGRGGSQHQAAQKRIKELAEALGFRGIIEKPMLDGQNSVDLWLERNSQTIACEISFTNTIENEAEKIIRLLKGGIPKVALICEDDVKGRRIEAAISSALDPTLATRSECFTTEAFIDHLKALPPPVPTPAERIRRGYKVKHSHSRVATDEQKAKEETAIRAIAESMQSHRGR